MDINGPLYGLGSHDIKRLVILMDLNRSHLDLKRPLIDLIRSHMDLKALLWTQRFLIWT